MYVNEATIRTNPERYWQLNKRKHKLVKTGRGSSFKKVPLSPLPLPQFWREFGINGTRGKRKSLSGPWSFLALIVTGVRLLPQNLYNTYSHCCCWVRYCCCPSPIETEAISEGSPLLNLHHLPHCQLLMQHTRPQHALYL